MKTEKLFNVLEGFDFNNVNNPEFKEDSVREEIIVPILKGLGYSASKPYQIIRSRGLLHPFVSIGSKKQDIYIIPDYLFEVDDKPAWILDAKSPAEQLTKSKHIEQAYSYAIHSEVRVNHFALCNGKDFVLYDVSKVEPLLEFPIRAIPLFWGDLERYLKPETIFSHKRLQLAKDLGLHLKRLGFDKFENLILKSVPISMIAQLDDNLFTSSSSVLEAGQRYVVSFDFDVNVLKQLSGKLPQEIIDKLLVKNPQSRIALNFADRVYNVDLECKIGENLEENNDEIFLPLIITNVL